MYLFSQIKESIKDLGRDDEYLKLLNSSEWLDFREKIKKTKFIISIFTFFFLTSCSTSRVLGDYESVYHSTKDVLMYGKYHEEKLLGIIDYEWHNKKRAKFICNGFLSRTVVKIKKRSHRELSGSIVKVRVAPMFQKRNKIIEKEILDEISNFPFQVK